VKVVVAGGHGQIALILQRLLAEAGHQPSIVRNPDQAGDLERVGSRTIVLDLEHTDPETLAAHLDGADAVVFAAGGGPNSGAARKLTMDRDGAILLADAAQAAGIRRYLMVSAIGADDYDPDSEEVFQLYLRAKSEADANLRARDLDWTVVRPGGLTNDPATGLVRAASSTGGGTVPRADVAALLTYILESGAARRAQFELVSGDRSIAEALAGL